MQEIHHDHNSIIKVIQKDFFSIPVSIRMVSLSIFLFILGRGLGGDTFFSIYIESIVNNVFRVAIIAAFLSFIKMIFSVNVGTLDDHSNMKSIIFLGKGIYVLTSIFFFLAGIEKSIVFLVIAVMLNGIGYAALFTSYESMIRKYGKKENRSTVFGLYFSSFNFAYVVGGLISAVLIRYISLPYVFLFVGIFSCISFITDTKLPNLSKKKIKAFLGKESFLHQFFHEVFSFVTIKKIFASLPDITKKLYQALGFEFIFNMLNYIGLIFIPIIAIQNNLSLSQIAIIFVIMRLPYVLDFFTGEFADKYSKRRFILIVLFFLSFLFALLGFKNSFGSIITISLGISVGLSLIRPVISGLISDYIDPGMGGKITGIQEFTSNFGSMCGAFIFGLLSLIFGMDNSFVIIGIIVFVFAGIGIIQRFHLFSSTHKA
ncbi:MAG: MFS transporter [Candidatus Absconditabacterales bacterium]